MSNSSPSGQYFIAVYAAAPGEFQVQASRVIFPVNIPPGPSFLDQLRAWVAGSTLGIAIIAVGGGLLLCICMGCFLQQCAPSCNRSLADKIALAEERDAKSARFIRSVRNIHLANTGTQAPSIARSVRNVSSRVLMAPLPGSAQRSRDFAPSSRRLRGGEAGGAGMSLRHMHVQLAAAASHASMVRVPGQGPLRSGSRPFAGVNPMVEALAAQGPPQGQAYLSPLPSQQPQQRYPPASTVPQDSARTHASQRAPDSPAERSPTRPSPGFRVQHVPAPVRSPFRRTANRYSHIG